MGFDIAPLWVVSMATDVMGSSLRIFKFACHKRNTKNLTITVVIPVKFNQTSIGWEY